MRRSLPGRLVTALCALGAPLFLSSASGGGVGALAASAEEGPVCRELTIAPHRNIRAELARHAARSGRHANPDVVVLNVRGYSYESGPDARLERVRLEILEILEEEAAFGTR